MDFNKIIEKYNYGEKLGNLLKQIYEEFVLYFGVEQDSIIYEAFLNCEIIVGENCYEALKKRNLLSENTNELVNEGDLKRASGVYSSMPLIKVNEKNNEFVLEDIKRIVCISSDNLDLEYVLSCLIHELSHLVKSYYKEYSLENNILIERSGLIERYYNLSKSAGEIKKDFIKEKGVGLEEGFTSVLEEDIAKRIVNPSYKSSGYGVVNVAARNFIKSDEDLKMFIMAEFYKDKSEIIKKYGEKYYDLELVVDKIYKYSLNLFANIFDKERFNMIKEEMNNYLKTEYLPLMEEIMQNKRELK